MGGRDGSRIDRIIDVARGAAPAGPDEREHREATRIPYNGHIALVELTPDGNATPPVLMTCQDISAGGVGAISRRHLSAGARGAILIQKSSGEGVVLSARIVHCRAIGQDKFECGIEFERDAAPPVSLDDFRAAGGELPRLGPARAA
jgi:PilZ domain